MTSNFGAQLLLYHMHISVGDSHWHSPHPWFWAETVSVYDVIVRFFLLRFVCVFTLHSSENSSLWFDILTVSQWSMADAETVLHMLLMFSTSMSTKKSSPSLIGLFGKLSYKHQFVQWLTLCGWVMLYGILEPGHHWQILNIELLWVNFPGTNQNRI